MEYKYIFGPVLSRRLGTSLGIDLVPYKVCNLNCVYCESGKTTLQTTERREYVPYDGIISELDHYLGLHPKLDYITFSGAGEPTLNSRLGDLIGYIKSHYPEIKLALITNGILLTKQPVREEVLKCDVILPSLDAASEMVFRLINRPVKIIRISDVAAGLTELRKIYKGQIWLEVFFIPGINDTPQELAALKKSILGIQPDKLQLNTLDRPGTANWVKPEPVAELEKLRDYFAPLETEIISKNSRHFEITETDANKEELIISTLKRRPCTVEELAKIVQMDLTSILKLMVELEKMQKVKSSESKKGKFYSIS